MKIVFLGTPKFATKPLQAILNAGFNVVAVVSQPDKPVGRKQILAPTPVKEIALINNIPCFQFERIKDNENVEKLRALNADVFVTCAYGQMLPESIINMPRLGVFNIHGSILPKYRGASPVQWSVINGEEETGITILKSEIGMDDGNILHIEKTKVMPNETCEELFERLGELAKTAIITALNMLKGGKYELTPQQHEKATFTKKLTKENSKVNFSNSAEEVKNYINGINMWPVAKVQINNMQLKVYKAEALTNAEIETLGLNNYAKIGTVAHASNKFGFIVRCGLGFVRFVSIQPENGKRMADTSFLNGKQIEVGSEVI